MINFLIGMTIAVIIFCLLMVLLSRKGAEEKNISNRMAYFSGVEASLRHTKESDKQRRHNVTFKKRTTVWIARCSRLAGPFSALSFRSCF